MRQHDRISDKIQITKGVTVVSVTAGDLFAETTAGTRQIIFEAGTGNSTENGVLLTLNCVAGKEMAGGSYMLDLIVRGCLNDREERYSVPVTFGTLTVEKVLTGDANGDGVIDTADVVRLNNYLANFDFEEGTSSVEIAAGADANGDGKVNTADIIRLKNYLANLDYETGESTVPLGPKA